MARAPTLAALAATPGHPLRRGGCGRRVPALRVRRRPAHVLIDGMEHDPSPDRSELEFEVQIDGSPPERRVMAIGELDLHTAPLLQDALRRAVEPGTERIVVDCRRLEFVDSAGLRAILVARHELAASDVRVVVAEPSPALERVLDMTNLRASLSE